MLNEYAYQYDDIGNRLSSLDLGTNRTYTANALNQYTLVGRVVPNVPQEEFAPQFDLDGNQTLIQTSTGIWSVTYNGENRPVLWECGSTNITMKFDRMGRRVEYVEAVSSVTNTHHRFVYDGYLCIQRLNAAANNAIDLAFGWDPTEPMATRPLWMQRPAGSYNFFYFHDGNKNVSDIVSYQSARGVPAHYEYSPFGTVIAATTNTAFTAFNVAEVNPYRFSSEYADDATGLVYYNYRHYNTRYGRWISMDPITEYGSINIYSFCGNLYDTFDFLGLKTSCTRAGQFDIIEFSIDYTPQERQFNQNQVMKDAEKLLKELRKIGYRSVGTVADNSLASAGQFIKHIMQILGFSERFSESNDDSGNVAQSQVVEFLNRNFNNRIFRVDGVLKYRLCACVNGHLRWTKKEELKYSENVNLFRGN